MENGIPIRLNRDSVFSKRARILNGSHLIP